MSHKITLTGNPCSTLRPCRDIFSFDMEEGGSAAVPKGLPVSKPITYTVYVNKKQLKKAKLDENNLRNFKLLIQGEPTLDMPIDECPGEIGVVCFQISVILEKESTASEEDIAVEEIKETVSLGAPFLPPVAAEGNTVTHKDANDVLPITAIIVPEDFLSTTPSLRKTQAVIDYVKQYGHLDEPIFLNKETLVLVDGNRRYLVAQQLEMSHVPVAYR